MKRLIHGLTLTLVLAAVVNGLVLADPAYGVDRCIVCGMDVSKYPHTRYVVEDKGGKSYATCGVQCGLTLHLRLGEKWKSSTATDLITNRSIDATKGFYVYKSSVITDMAPGFISFGRRENAEKFTAGFGGQVLDYEEALKLWKNRMK